MADLAHHLDGRGAGVLGGRLEHLGALRVVARDAVGLREREEGLGIGLHEVKQGGADGLGISEHALDVVLHVRELLLARGEVAHHGAEGNAQGTHQGRGTAAARHGLLGSQDLGKRRTATIGQTLSHHNHPFLKRRPGHPSRPLESV